MSQAFTITNPLALGNKSLTIGAAPGKGQSNVGSLISNIPAAKTPAPKVTVTKGVQSSTKPKNTANNSNQKTTASNNSTKKNTVTAKATSTAASRAAAAAAAQARNDYNNLRNNTFSSITDLINGDASQYKSGLLDWADTYKQKQNAINSDAVKNELTKVQGTRDVLDMVGTGVRSSGVTLNNNNASNSSAADGFARAYSQIGQKELGKVGNGYEMGKNDIATAQSDLGLMDAQQRRHAQEGKDATINSIVGAAADKLGALNQSAAYASLPDRVDVEAQKAAIRNQALAALVQYDSILNDAVNNNPVSSKNDNYSKALSQANAGLSDGAALQLNSSVPQQLQGTGPFSSSLPLFTY